MIMAAGVKKSTKNGDFDLFQTVARDETAKVFLKVLYLVMWDESDELEEYANEKYFEFGSDVHEAIIFLGGFMRKVHSKVFKHYFKRNRISKRTVFKLLLNYSRSMMVKCENVFFVWLHSLTLTDTLFCYLEEKDFLVESLYFKTLASVWWEYIFNKIIKYRFYARGGWEQFFNYILEDFYPRDLPENCEQLWEVPLGNLNFNYFELEVSAEENYPKSDEDNHREQVACKENRTKRIHSHSEDKNLNVEYITNSVIAMEQNVRNIAQKNTEKVLPTCHFLSVENAVTSNEATGSKISQFTHTVSNPSKQQDGESRHQPSSERASCIVPKKRRNLNDQGLCYTERARTPVMETHIPHNYSKPANSELNVTPEKIEIGKPFNVLFPDDKSVPSQQFGNLSKKPRLENEENEQQMYEPISETESGSAGSTISGGGYEDESRLAAAYLQHLENQTSPKTSTPLSNKDIFGLLDSPKSRPLDTNQSQFETITFQDLRSDSD